MPEPGLGLMAGAADGPGEAQHSGKMGGGLQQKDRISYGAWLGSMGLEYSREHWTDSEEALIADGQGSRSRDSSTRKLQKCVAKEGVCARSSQPEMGGLLVGIGDAQQPALIPGPAQELEAGWQPRLGHIAGVAHGHGDGRRPGWRRYLRRVVPCGRQDPLL